MSDIVIQKLEYPNNVRFKASMYLGDTTTPTTAIREIIDNSLDEAMNGFADKVIINIDDNTFWNSSLDNGRGIPIYKDTDKEGDEEITTDIFSKLHSGGKFEANLVSIGTFGIGSAATNAVSDDFIAVINIPNNTNTREKPEWIKEGISKGDDTYLLHFKRGLFHNKFTSKYQEVKDYLLELGIKEYQIPNDFSSWSSFVLCKPDSTIFSSLKSKYKERELQLQKMLNPNIDLQFNGKQVEIFDITKDSFKQTQFFNDKVFSLTVDYEAPYEYHGQSRTSKNRFIVAFGYSQNDFSTVTDGSVNTLDTPDGYHVNLASRLLQKSFKDIFPDMEAKDAIYGLRLFCLVMTNASEYTSQDKVRLGRIYGINEADLQSLFKRELIKIVNENKEYFESLCLRINEYKATIGTLSQKNFVKSVVIYGDDKRAKSRKGSGMFDCSTRDRESAELFIAEGKSAGGSIVAARDSKIHAVLPLRGKLFNSSNAELEQALNNREILEIINSLGVGITPYVDLSKRRYGKVIIACDADVDGCFTGDTKISLLDGTEVEIQELVGREEFWVYSCTPEGEIKPGRGHSARVTKHVDTLYHITLDNGEVIKCTDNHPFMMRDGTYKRADELKEGMSLMPLYRKCEESTSYVQNNRPCVWDNKHNTWKTTHRMVAEEVMKDELNAFYEQYSKTKNKGDIPNVHHIDENIHNNVPSNLKILKASEHVLHHAHQNNPEFGKIFSETIKKYHKNGHYDYENSVLVSKYNGSEKNSQVATERNKKMWQNEDYRQHMSEKISANLSTPEAKARLSANCSSQWQDEQTRITMLRTPVVNLMKKCLEQYGEITPSTYGKVKYRNAPVWENALSRLPEEVVRNNTLREYVSSYNHKITKIEVVKLDKSIPVYDITVDEYHNFALTSGVFVHNCHIQVLVLGVFAKFLPELIEAGMLYLGLAPIYEQTIGGKTSYYWLDKMDGFQHNKPFNRYKGLGSCPPKTLRDTLIDPNIRRLIQITPENINEAVNLLQDAYLRRELMVENGIVDFEAMQSVGEDDVDDLLKYSPQSLTVEEQELVQQQL